MSNFARTSLLVVTDRTFPRAPDGRPDATKFAEYRINSDLDMATVLLVADDYPAPGMRDPLLIAIARDLGLEIAFLNTTRTAGNEYAKTFEWWLSRTQIAIGEIVFYGKGLWA